MTPAPSTSAGPDESPTLPPVGHVYAARSRVEILEFFRQKEALVFTLIFPSMLLLIFGAVLNYDIAPGLTFVQYFLAGMVASGVLASGFQNLAITISIERSEGRLKRMSGTPMPKSAYFVGKVVQVLVVGVATIALLLLVGVIVYGIDLPATPGKWLTFVWVTLLGLASCSLLGIAFSSAIKNGKSAPAIVTPIALVLQFISGVFFVFTDLPSWMQSISAIFPLKWLTQGMRAAFLPDSFAAQEAAGSFELEKVALVLAAWTIVGMVLCVVFFRWRDRADG
ncbi:MAG: ABC transporter permease [Geodermatophilaceae bacterium]|nr:ABC transporter permease [Geodermatophilaceae bacterium]